MKRIEWMLSLGLMLLALISANAYAESPREEFKQMVEQLQQSPSDTALREKIIRLAQTLKPAPAVPEAAEKHEGRGQFAFQSAKSSADYLDAAKEYEQAIAAAPWIAGYYSDLCTIYQKAEKYAEAKRNCEIYLLSSPAGAEAGDTRKRIAGLEFAIEKANSPEAQAAKANAPEAAAAGQREKDAALIKNLDGGVWLCSDDQFGRMVMEVNGLTITYKHYAKSGNVIQYFQLLLTGTTTVMPKAITCHEGQHYGQAEDSWWCPGKLVISPDGTQITRSIARSPSDSYYVNGTETCQRTR